MEKSIEKINIKDLFKWNPSKATLLISLPKPEIPGSVFAYAQKFNFMEKPEFHASIISFANGKNIIDKFGSDQVMILKIRELADNFSWKIKYDPEYFVVEKYYDRTELNKSGYGLDVPEHTRKTIVQKISIPDLAPFYAQLSEVTGIDFSIPFSHLTLFSSADYEPMRGQGIGLYSEEDFKKYSKEYIKI